LNTIDRYISEHYQTADRDIKKMYPRVIHQISASLAARNRNAYIFELTGKQLVKGYFGLLLPNEPLERAFGHLQHYLDGRIRRVVLDGDLDTPRTYNFKENYGSSILLSERGKLQQDETNFFDLTKYENFLLTRPKEYKVPISLFRKSLESPQISLQPGISRFLCLDFLRDTKLKIIIIDNECNTDILNYFRKRYKYKKWLSLSTKKINELTNLSKFHHPEVIVNEHAIIMQEYHPILPEYQKSYTIKYNNGVFTVNDKVVIYEKTVEFPKMNFQKIFVFNRDLR